MIAQTAALTLALSILAFRSEDGYKWRFASVIANESQVPWSTFGPNEQVTKSPN